ncbi:MAG: ABC transporter ATP-binding protein [Candidatus Poribacteria bacterium]|nr:MAG: ABC transporter ATP-binding protein [Candidatus Poribacteria bacterium]
MEAMVEVWDLTKYYGTYIGIEGVSFSIARGEVVGFLGPNGAGKTTTMRILTCSMPATRGEARVAGFDVLRDSLQVRRRVGYLPETPPLYSEMTVEGYLRFVGTIKGVRGRRLRERLEYVLEACDIAHMRRRIVGHLSKGYRQRVGIAQALIHDPEVMIFDEPTSGLDPGQIIEIRQLIRELGRERTVILSTHILAEAQATCRRLLIINQGSLVGDVHLDEGGQVLRIQTPDGRQVGYGDRRRVALLARGVDAASIARFGEALGLCLEEAQPERDGLRAVLSAPAERDPRPALVQKLVAEGGELLELRELRPTVEEVFLSLTQPSAPTSTTSETLRPCET